MVTEVEADGSVKVLHEGYVLLKFASVEEARRWLFEDAERLEREAKVRRKLGLELGRR